jgi:N utilization substance protein A
MVMNELRGEKIDIIKWTEDPGEFVANALSPAKVKEVRLQDDGDTALVIVPDYQLSLAIGKEGQNARLAARLTGLRVDIKSESQMRQETEAVQPEAEAEAPPEDAAPAETGVGGDGEGSDE